MPEWQDPAFVKQRKWETFNTALLSRRTIPCMTASCHPSTPARQRLAYDELLANQLALLLIRANLRGGPNKGRPVHGSWRIESQGYRRPALHA